jgi:hypothetical protein
MSREEMEPTKNVYSDYESRSHEAAKRILSPFSQREFERETNQRNRSPELVQKSRSPNEISHRYFDSKKSSKSPDRRNTERDDRRESGSAGLSRRQNEPHFKGSRKDQSPEKRFDANRMPEPTSSYHSKLDQFGQTDRDRSSRRDKVELVPKERESEVSELTFRQTFNQDEVVGRKWEDKSEDKVGGQKWEDKTEDFLRSLGIKPTSEQSSNDRKVNVREENDRTSKSREENDRKSKSRDENVRIRSRSRSPSKRSSRVDQRSPERPTRYDHKSPERSARSDRKSPERSTRSERKSLERPTRYDRKSPERSAGSDRRSPERSAGSDRRSSERPTRYDRKSPERSAGSDRRSPERSSRVDQKSVEKSARPDQKSPERPTRFDQKIPEKSSKSDQESYKRISRFDQISPEDLNPVNPTKNDDQVKETTDRSQPRDANLLCVCCLARDHLIAQCQKFVDLPMNDRWTIVRKLSVKFCVKCLNVDHVVTECDLVKNASHSGTCCDRYHTLLHPCTIKNGAVSFLYFLVFFKLLLRSQMYRNMIVILG